MTNCIFTNKAIEDLTNIWEYTFEEWSEQQADKYYKSLIATCQKLSNNPNQGKPYDQVAEALLGFRINRHIIFYRKLDSDLIEIIRILHGRMDIETRIRMKE